MQQSMPQEGEDVAIRAELVQAMITEMPLRALFNAVGQGEEALQQFLEILNK